MLLCTICTHSAVIEIIRWRVPPCMMIFREREKSLCALHTSSTPERRVGRSQISVSSCLHRLSDSGATRVRAVHSRQRMYVIHMTSCSSPLFTIYRLHKHRRCFPLATAQPNCVPPLCERIAVFSIVLHTSKGSQGISPPQTRVLVKAEEDKDPCARDLYTERPYFVMNLARPKHSFTTRRHVEKAYLVHTS